MLVDSTGHLPDYAVAINLRIDNVMKTFFQHRIYSWSNYFKKFSVKVFGVYIYTPSYTDWYLGILGTFWWFADQVGAGKQWDVKLKKGWETQFKGTPFLGREGKFIYNGKKIDAEVLGNITYGFLEVRLVLVPQRYFGVEGQLL